MSFFANALIWLFSMFDNVIYGFIGYVYEVLMRIADATLFNQDTFREFSTRIYSLLGIFMLFKLSFSLITYTINPDDLFEKSKGVQNLIGRVLISLLLLVVTPTIFIRARELQKIILDNSVLESIILGIGASGEQSAVVGGDIGGVGDTKNTAGTRMSFVILSSFLRPNAYFTECRSGMYLTTGVNPTCLTQLNEKNSTEGIPVGNYVDTAWKYKDVSILLDSNLLQSKMKIGQSTEEVFIMDYKYVISSLAGIFVVYILIVFCIDIGIRSVKLGFLELIAPIPIIMYIDPKASKDSAFSKWGKTCISTYMDLFLRLAAIYFAIFIFDNINLITGITNDAFTDGLVKVFIILGALAFAKQLPDLLKDFFPGMGKDSFNMNILKRPGVKELGGLGMAGAGLAIGGGIGMLANVGKALQKDENGERHIGRAIPSAIGGALSGTARTLGQLAKNKGKKGVTSGRTALAQSIEARNLRQKRHDKGYGTGQLVSDKINRFTGNKDAMTIEKQDALVKKLQQEVNDEQRAISSIQSLANQQHSQLESSDQTYRAKSSEHSRLAQQLSAEETLKVTMKNNLTQNSANLSRLRSEQGALNAIPVSARNAAQNQRIKDIATEMTKIGADNTDFETRIKAAEVTIKTLSPQVTAAETDAKAAFAARNAADATYNTTLANLQAQSNKLEGPGGKKYSLEQESIKLEKMGKYAIKPRPGSKKE